MSVYSLNNEEIADELLSYNDTEAQFLGLHLMYPDPAESLIRNAREKLQELRGESLDDILLCGRQGTAKIVDTYLEDAAWDKMNRQMKRASSCAQERKMGIIANTKMGEWFQRSSSRTFGKKVTGERPPLTRNCHSCSSYHLMQDAQLADLICSDCGTTQPMETFDVTAFDRAELRAIHRYYPHIHFRSFIRSVMGESAHSKVPHIRDLLVALSPCETYKEGRAVLKAKGLSRLYSKVTTLMNLSKEGQWKSPVFTCRERQMLEERHKFWFGIFQHMGPARPRKYFFTTRYMLLRCMLDIGIYNRHLHFLKRYIFDVGNTAVINERQWLKLVKFAISEGYDVKPYKPIPCYIGLLRADIAKKRKRKETSCMQTSNKRSKPAQPQQIQPQHLP